MQQCDHWFVWLNNSCAVRWCSVKIACCYFAATLHKLRQQRHNTLCTRVYNKTTALSCSGRTQTTTHTQTQAPDTTPSRPHHITAQSPSHQNSELHSHSDPGLAAIIQSFVRLAVHHLSLGRYRVLYSSSMSRPAVHMTITVSFKEHACLRVQV